MARTNLKPDYSHVRTHEGAPAFPHLPAEQQLRRSVAACMLWENEFYEDGQAIATRIMETVAKCKPSFVADLAVEARSKMNLRHAPLWLVVALARIGKLSHHTVVDVIQRADELSELLALYWKDGKRPIDKQIKLGLAKAFQKFDAYALAKYNRDAAIKLRDVLFMVHAKPKDEEQAALWKKLVDGTLESPDTWEVALSAGADKKGTWERLIREGKLGYLALLRNLRNMAAVNVDDGLIRSAIIARKRGAERVLPFRYIAAARAAPQYEPYLDAALSAAIDDLPQFAGKTIVLVDVSGSMDVRLSAKSDMTRMDAAAALAAIFPGDVRLFTFSNSLIEVPPRKGMAGVDAIIKSQTRGGTSLGAAVRDVTRFPHDRLIVITDEQAHDSVPPPVAERSYMINVASNKNGVGYGKWLHIDGFSESVLRFIAENESDAR